MARAFPETERVVYTVWVIEMHVWGLGRNPALLFLIFGSNLIVIPGCSLLKTSRSPIHIPPSPRKEVILLVVKSRKIQKECGGLFPVEFILVASKKGVIIPLTWS